MVTLLVWAQFASNIVDSFASRNLFGLCSLILRTKYLHKDVGISESIKKHETEKRKEVKNSMW